MKQVDDIVPDPPCPVPQALLRNGHLSLIHYGGKWVGHKQGEYNDF